jgi:ABC-type Mn2+/Zn2+ transport system permease subunit
VLLAVSWTAAALVCAAGLVTSFKLDLPTGPLIVCLFGLVLLAAGIVSRRYSIPGLT